MVDSYHLQLFSWESYWYQHQSAVVIPNVPQDPQTNSYCSAQWVFVLSAFKVCYEFFSLWLPIHGNCCMHSVLHKWLANLCAMLIFLQVHYPLQRIHQIQFGLVSIELWWLLQYMSALLHIGFMTNADWNNCQLSLVFLLADWLVSMTLSMPCLDMPSHLHFCNWCKCMTLLKPQQWNHILLITPDENSVCYEFWQLEWHLTCQCSWQRRISSQLQLW